MSLLNGHVAARLARVESTAMRQTASRLVMQAALARHGRRVVRSARPVGEDARREVYRGFWTDAAQAVGAALEDLPGGRLRLSRGRSTTVVWDNLVPLDHPVSLRLAGSRPDTHAALRAAGLRVPRHVLVDRTGTGAAHRFLHDVGSCVVKPAAFTGAGTAITCGIRTTDDLARATAYARRWGDRVIVEEQAQGQEHRVLVLDGAVLGVVARRAPHLTGDGRSSVAQLVAAENTRRAAAQGRAGLFPLTLDLDAVQTQRAAGRSLRSVPAAGERFAVKTAVNENNAADNEGIAHAAPDLAAVAVTATAALGLRLAAVEIIVPVDGSDSVVLEVNSTPGLHYHYQVAEGTHQVRVARPLLEVLLSEPPLPPLESP